MSQPAVSAGVERASIRRQSGGEGPALKLFLLGGFRLEVDGEPLDVRGAKAKALLAYLALPAGRLHGRQQLANLLWGGMGDEHARHNLRQCVSALRRLLGEGVVVSEGNALYLDPRTVDVDVAVLERGDADCVSEIEDGDLLEGLQLREDPFDEWLEHQRGRLKRLACHRLGARSAALAAAGAVDDAIAMIERQLDLEPTLEEAHRRLMELYAGSGRRVAAIRQYERCVGALERNLGVGPSAETVRLHRSVRESGLAADAAPGEALSGPRVSGDRDGPSIVVLPFANGSGDPDRDYLGIGIAEDVTTALSRFGSLFVISPVTTFALRARTREGWQLARELGVRYVVHGSVRQSGARMRLTAHLVDASTGAELWAEQYDRSDSDVFAMEDEIVDILVATVAGRVEAAALARSRRKPPGSLAAYDCFLRGKDYHHRFTLEDNTRALEMFERAVALDPGYALAYAWLSCTLFQRARFDPDPSLRTRCFDTIQQAYALDNAESEVHRILGAFHLEWKDFERAEYHHGRALVLNPNDDRIVCQYGDLETYCGRPGEGERWVRRAMRLNPYTMPRYWLRLARALYHQNRFDEALTALCREDVLVADRATYLAAVLARLGRAADARAVVARLERERGGVTVAGLTDPMPYRWPADREAVVEALRLAGVRR